MDAMNQFEGTAVMMLLFVVRLGIPILGIYGIACANRRLCSWLKIEDPDAPKLVTT